jgi:flagellar hook protein FlgE
MNISANLNSIQAHQTWMNNNANNIANLNTDGFIPTDTTISNPSKESITAQSSLASDNKSIKSQTDLAKELPEQINIQAATNVNVTTIKTQDEMLGTLLDIKA